MLEDASDSSFCWRRAETPNRFMHFDHGCTGIDAKTVGKVGLARPFCFLEHFQEKCVAVFCLDMRNNKEIEHFFASIKTEMLEPLGKEKRRQ